MSALSLVDTISEDVTLRRASAREWCAPCPRCGGRDRLHLTETWWFCRGCSPARRDVIGYLHEIRGLPWPEAYREAGLDRPERCIRPLAPRRPGPPQIPSPEWRAAATGVAMRAEEALWMPAGGPAREILHGRGLTDATIRQHRLGYLPRGWHAGLRCPGPAVTIPWWAGGEIWQVKLRFLDPLITRDGDPLRYLPLTWGRDDPRRETAPAGVGHLYGADGLAGRDVAILTEGEMDAALLGQMADGLAGVVTLGSCSAPVTYHAATALLRVGRIHLAFDDDDAGRAGAARLKGRFPCMEIVALPPGPGKDVTDRYLAGVDLRQWVSSLLA